MRYLPQTDEDIGKMLSVVGAKSLEDLYVSVPPDCRRNRPLDLPEPMTELALNRHMDVLAANMATSSEYRIFMGAGSYDHFIPEVVRRLVSRSEFYTAYTPYQPEISQGTLQAVYEYQTLVNRLLGMDVANASMYDGASAPCRSPSDVHPDYPAVTKWSCRRRSIPFTVGSLGPISRPPDSRCSNFPGPMKRGAVIFPGSPILVTLRGWRFSHPIFSVASKT